MARFHFDACAGHTHGIHSMIIQVVHCMICVTVCILYVDKNDKLKTHYRQKGAYTHDCLLVESRLHTMGWRLFKKHKPISLFSHLQMVSSRFSNAERGFGVFFPPGWVSLNFRAFMKPFPALGQSLDEPNPACGPTERLSHPQASQV